MVLKVLPHVCVCVCVIEKLHGLRCSMKICSEQPPPGQAGVDKEGESYLLGDGATIQFVCSHSSRARSEQLIH